MKKFSEESMIDISNSIVAILHDYSINLSELRELLFLIATKQIGHGVINQDCLFK